MASFSRLGGGAGAVSHLFQGAGCTGCTVFLFQGRVSLQLQLGQLPGELLLQGSFPCSFLSRGQPGPALGPGPGPLLPPQGELFQLFFSLFQGLSVLCFLFQGFFQLPFS